LIATICPSCGLITIRNKRPNKVRPCGNCRFALTVVRGPTFDRLLEVILAATFQIDPKKHPREAILTQVARARERYVAREDLKLYFRKKHAGEPWYVAWKEYRKAAQSKFLLKRALHGRIRDPKLRSQLLDELRSDEREAERNRVRDIRRNRSSH
jgi:hypothetical protein